MTVEQKHEPESYVVLSSDNAMRGNFLFSLMFFKTAPCKGLNFVVFLTDDIAFVKPWKKNSDSSLNSR